MSNPLAAPGTCPLRKDRRASVRSKNHDANKIKTFITQEMLKKGFLAGTTIYPCIKHSDSIVENYLDALDSTFESMKLSEHGTRLIDKLLDGPVCHSGFSRLN